MEGKRLTRFAMKARQWENNPWGKSGGERALTPLTLLLTNQPTEHCGVCGSRKVLGRKCTRCGF